MLSPAADDFDIAMRRIHTPAYAWGTPANNGEIVLLVGGRLSLVRGGSTARFGDVP